MTADPLLTYRSDVAVHLPWRPVPTDYMLGTVADLRLHSAVERLMWKLWLIVDDAGRFVASSHHLARKTGLTRSKALMRQLDALVDARLVELYTVEGQQYGHIRGYNELVKLVRAAVVLYPPPGEGGVEGASDGGVSERPAELFPPTPPFLTQDQRPESESESLARVHEQAGAPAPARKVPPLTSGVVAAVDRWWAAYCEQRESLPQAARGVKHAQVEDLVREMLAEHHVRTVRRALERCRKELGQAAKRKWWSDPLGNLRRKVEWGSEDEGHAAPSEPPPPPAEPTSHEHVTAAAVEPTAEQFEAPAKVVADAELEGRWSSLDLEPVEPWDRKHWVSPLRCVGRDEGGRVVLCAPDASHARWVSDHFAAFLSQAFRKVGETADLRLVGGYLDAR